MKRIALLMAGGKSERLWPLSRVVFPKQFLCITGDDQTMIQKTVGRLLPIIDYEDIYIVTNQQYVPIVKEQLPQIPIENILAEPMPRDTAPCLAFATAVLSTKYDDAVMLVLASDHLIREEDIYRADLQTASNFAEKHEALVTIGIRPAYPEVGYGYIHFDQQHVQPEGLYSVHRFVEKPDLATAQRYCASGEYLWNSGMFIWRLSVIEEHFQRLTPVIYKGMMAIRSACAKGQQDKALPEIFGAFPKISIDYAIMEHASSIYTIPGTFQWLDVGNWNAIPQIIPPNEAGNVHIGDALYQDSTNVIVHSSQDRLIALIGLDNLVVVDTPDALLISDRNKVGDIKKVLEHLRIQGRADKL